ncbi:MAG TPA: hypothetical protein VFK32_03380 [Tepidiformaceae bacterium]|nr:hypothetical protein [Tepidiformaceae bacterium]
MKIAIAVVMVVLAVSAQVTIAPLFPLGASIADMVLVTLVLATAFAGPRTGMFAVPFAAICLGFVSDRDAGLLLLAFIPILPLARWLETSAVPVSGYWRVALTVLGTGLWARLVLAAGVFVNGGDLPLSTLVFSALLPGALLDWALLTLAYFPHRFVGWEVRPMDVQRGGIG